MQWYACQDNLKRFEVPLTHETTMRSGISNLRRTQNQHSLLSTAKEIIHPVVFDLPV